MTLITGYLKANNYSQKFCLGLSFVSTLMIGQGAVVARTSDLPLLDPTQPTLGNLETLHNIEVAQVPTVAELSDVQPSDWTYQALINLVERYDVLIGYPDGAFQGNRSVTREEFAAALSQVIDKVVTLSLSPDELLVVERLQTEFGQEMAQVSPLIEDLELRSQLVEAQNFSPTVKLSGQVVMAATFGGYEGDEIIAPRGAVIANDAQNSFFLNRVALSFNTSFDGEDLLQIRLVSGSNGPNDNVAGNLEPNFGSTLDYAVQGRNNNLSIARAYYAFYPVSDLRVVLAPLYVISDFVDNNRAVPPSSRGFSTQALASNFVLLPRPLGAGAALDWNPGGGDFSLRAAYVAGDRSNSTGENTCLVGGGGPNDVSLFPTSGGSSESGLFGDPHQRLIELEYSPSETLALRLQYAGGQIFGSKFDGVGANAELMLSPDFSLFGRYGYARYRNTTLGDLTPQYWMAGVTYANVFKQGDLSGIAVTQPFVESRVGNATQTIFETFYDFPITDGVNIAPFGQVVVSPANQDTNGTIMVGGIRTVFPF